jgi:hypothetical protein
MREDSTGNAHRFQRSPIASDSACSPLSPASDARSTHDADRRLKAARENAALGLCIFPVVSRTKKPPRGLKWTDYKTTRATDDDFRKWFGGYSLAVALGDASGGLHCRDFDEIDAYDAWAAEQPELARTLPTSVTGRGSQVFFRADPAQVRAASASGKGGIINLGNGELRGNGAYCVLPPSRHHSGRLYRWVVPFRSMPPLLDIHKSGFLNASPSVQQNATERTEENRENRGERTQSCLLARSLEEAFGLETGIAIYEAIRKTVPTQTGQRHRLIFEFARLLKGVPKLADLEPYVLEPAICEWHRNAVHFISTKDLETTRLDFAMAWGRIRHAAGAKPLAEIFAKATTAEIPPDVDQRVKAPGIRLLAIACRELQREAGSAPFFLSVRTAGEHLGVDFKTAWRWLKTLEEYYRLLKIEAPGDRRLRKATRFRYLGVL